MDTEELPVTGLKELDIVLGALARGRRGGELVLSGDL